MAIKPPSNKGRANTAPSSVRAKRQRTKSEARSSSSSTSLATVGEQWLGTKIAQRALGLRSVNTVKAWARRGILRSILLPNGRVKVHRDDVAKWAAVMDADTYEELPSDEELRQLTADRGGSTPWGHD